MSTALLSAQQRTLTVAAVVLIVALGLGGAGLAVAARVHQSVSAQTKARQQVALWLVPIEEFRADNGSYAGMTIALVQRYTPQYPLAWTGARIVFASRDRYCIERETPPVLSRAGSLVPIVSGSCTRAATMAAPLAHDGSPPDMPSLAADTVFTLAGRPRSASDGMRAGWLFAQLMRPLMQGYWLEHAGSFQGASSAELRRTYGSSAWLGLDPGPEIVTATPQAYCATISYRGATVSFHGPSGRVTKAGCS